MDDLQRNKIPVPDGEEKQFGDGSVRRLTTTKGGVRRWLSIHEGEEESGGQDGGAASPSVMPVPVEEKPLEFINREDWIEYNQYLTMENPYLNITNYEEGLTIWLAKVYEYDGRYSIYKEQENLYGESKQKEINDLEGLYVKSSNEFLALQMFKICALIQEIEKYDHSFDYDHMINQGASWKDFIDYLEAAKEHEY